MSARRIAILSDVHANPFALDPTLRDIQQAGVDAVWCLGDILGRGPDPIGTSVKLKALYDQQAPADQRFWLAGNHDWMVVKKLGTDYFSDVGEDTTGGMKAVVTDVAIRHRQMLENYREQVAWLWRLPVQHAAGGVAVAHGRYSPGETAFGMGITEAVLWAALYTHPTDPLAALPEAEQPAYRRARSAVTRYTRTAHIGLQVEDLRAGLPTVPRLVCFGHTHERGLWRWDAASGVTAAYTQGVRVYDLTPGAVVVVNPGSVGFARYNTVMPSYVILTLDGAGGTIEFRDVPYTFSEDDAMELEMDMYAGYPEELLTEIKKTSSSYPPEAGR